MVAATSVPRLMELLFLVILFVVRAKLAMKLGIDTNVVFPRRPRDEEEGEHNVA